MNYACIGSGSSGNAAVIGHGRAALLLDCGLAMRELARRLEQLGLQPSDLLGIVVTHEHGDHIRGVPALARRYDLPVWMSRGTHRRMRDTAIPDVRFFCAEQPFNIGPYQLHPFAVPHDAAEACQFTISDGNQKLVILTDLGSVTPRVIDSVQAASALILECNYDEDMLRHGPYPPALQARVGGRYGHLSNGQAASLLRAIDTRELKFILLAHLSEQNNTPQQALRAIATALPDGGARVEVLSPSHCSEWFSLGAVLN